MTSPGSGSSQVPPGFRFHPTDEELVNFYLRKKVALEKFDLDVIRDVDLNKLEPWDLNERCRIDTTQQTEWYFFSHKDKKYPTGTRTNRATAAGFWKATGRDKAVHSSYKRIGMRKTLVFYKGRAPHGQKTDWIMHEYRLEDCETGIGGNEDGWVVCRVFKKRIHHQKPGLQETQRLAAAEEEQSSLIDPNWEYYKSFQQDGSAAASSMTFSCKQEMEFEERLPQVPFMQLPQLESPKNTCNTSFSNVCDQGRRLFLDMPTMEAGSSGKLLFSCDDSLRDSYGESEWSVLAEAIPRENSRFQSEFSSLISTDISALPFFATSRSISHHQPADQLPPTCEVELWNFTR